MAADAKGRLWKSLRGWLPADCHATRIENSLTGEHAGFPDVHYTYLETTGSIELKSAKKLPMGKAGLRQSQIDWIDEENRAGGLVWILVEAYGHYHLVRGLYAHKLNDMSLLELTQSSSARWEAGTYESRIFEALLLNKA